MSAPKPILSTEQQLRYARHLTLPGFGAEAQRKLLDSSVLLIGAGGLGSPSAMYLAAAGVGRIGIVDDDIVDLTNLQRQLLHGTEDSGRPKVESAEETLSSLNPEIEIVAVQKHFSADNARQLISEYDLVLDGADNFPTRYLINDAAYFEGKPVVHGSIYLYEGQVTVLDPPRGPCYRCLFPTPPAPGTVPSCAEAGVLGVLPGVIGTLQATEAIKFLTGLGKPLTGKLLSYDALEMSFRTLRIGRRTSCPLCGDNPSITEVEEIVWSCDLGDEEIPEMSPQQYRQIRDNQAKHLLLDVRKPKELEGGQIAGNVNIPLGELKKRLDELASWRDELVVCQCQVGVRSRKAASLLREHGFSKVANLAGGYLAWLKDETEKEGEEAV